MKVGWVFKSLTEVCQIKPPKAEAQRRLAASDVVSFVPMEDLGIDQKILVPTKTRPLGEVAGSYTYFADGDVLLAKITPCFENGKLCIAENLSNGVGFGSSEYIVFRPRPEVDKTWLYYFLSRESFRKEGATHMSGAVGHKRVSKEFIESCPCPVPPLPEQHRIVALLDEAFDGIATARAYAAKNLQNARTLFESHLQSVFMERGAGWMEKRLEDAVDARCTLSYGIVQPGNDVPSGLPVVRPTDLSRRVITIEGLKRIDPKLADGYKRTTLRGNELLLCVRGSTGVVSVASNELAGANVTRGIVPVMFEPSMISQKFGYFMMVSEGFQRQIRVKTYGAALMQINIGDLREISIAFPPLNEQKRMAAKLDEMLEDIQHLESLYQRKLAALDELKQSLLHQAFSGAL